MGRTRDALYQAYTGEAKAVLRLRLYAERAEAEGLPQMAKLFRVIAFSEEIHGARALRVLKEIKSTEENLAEAFEKETRVAGVAYDAFLRQAEEILTHETERKIRRFRTILEPSLLLFTGAVTALMVFTVMLPVFQAAGSHMGF